MTCVGLLDSSRASELIHPCRHLTLLQSGGVRLPRKEVSVSQGWEVGHMTMSINVRMKG